jgi:hypothetical protein
LLLVPPPRCGSFLFYLLSTDFGIEEGGGKLGEEEEALLLLLTTWFS